MRHSWRTGGVAAALLVFASLGVQVRAQDLLIVSSANEGAKRLRATNTTAPFFVTSGSFTTVTTESVTIPTSLNQALIVARFSGESLCSGASGGFCSVRILVDGVEMNPADSATYGFDSPGDDPLGGNSSERTSGILLAGTHIVTVQAAVLNGATQFGIDDWQLTLEVWQVS
jgi:hypothetical protein